jgi:hypothetical protein
MPSLNIQARPNNVIIDFQTQFLGIVSIEEMSQDVYGANRYILTTENQIATEDCPLQGLFTQYISSYVCPGKGGLGIWYNSFEGTYNGEEASFEGWTATTNNVGHGYYLGKGALGGYILLYTIDGTSGVVYESIELVQRDMKKSIDFEFYYAVTGIGGMSVDDAGIWYFDDVQHSGSITSASKKYLSGDIYFECDLLLFDVLPPTTFNSIGYGPFEFDGYYKYRPAGFIGTMKFHFDDWQIMGLILAEGTGSLAGCLITGFVTGLKDGPDK